MRGRHARSEACLLTRGLARPDLGASGEAACLRCPGCELAMSLSRRWSCAVIRLLVPRLRVVLSMLERLGLRDPDIGLLCWISRLTCSRKINSQLYNCTILLLYYCLFLEDYKLIDAHLTFYYLFPSKVYKSHLYCLALDPVDPAVADGADHDEQERHPGHGVRAVLA